MCLTPVHCDYLAASGQIRLGDAGLALIRAAERTASALNSQGEVGPLRSNIVPAWIGKRQHLKELPGYDTVLTPAAGSALEGVQLLFSGAAQRTTEDPCPSDRQRRMRVLINGEYWTRTGHDIMTALDTLTQQIVADDLMEYGSTLQHLNPNRVDLCTDVYGYEWSECDLRRFTGRHRVDGVILRAPPASGQPQPKARTRHRAAEEPSEDYIRCELRRGVCGLMIGARGAGTYLKIYSKTEEIRQQHPERAVMLHDRWEAAGVPTDGLISPTGSRVFRIEAELGYATLDRYGIGSLGDLVRISGRCEAAIWSRVCIERRHIIQGSASRETRCDSSPVWLTIANAGSQEVLPQPVLRPAAPVRTLSNLLAGVANALIERDMHEGESWMAASERILSALPMLTMEAARRRDKRSVLRLGGIVVLDRDTIARHYKGLALEQIGQAAQQRIQRAALDRLPRKHHDHYLGEPPLGPPAAA